MTFVSFPCPTALARTSTAVLNSNGEGEHFHLVSDLSRISFSLLHYYDASLWGFTSAFYDTEEVSSHSYFFGVFLL